MKVKFAEKTMVKEGAGEGRMVMEVRKKGPKEEEEVAEWREQIERAIRKVDIGQFFGFLIFSCCYFSYL